MSVKVRFHRGVSAALRRRLVKRGMALDEEIAQGVLSGLVPVVGIPADEMARHRDEVLSPETRIKIMEQWEAEHPDRNPFAPAFAERMIAYVQRLSQIVSTDDPDLEHALSILEEVRIACIVELDIGL